MRGYQWVYTPQPSPVVPGYTILEPLGQGAQGSVFRARHDLLQREVALKLVYRSELSVATLARFRREAELLARFDHPGVIRVHQWGETAEALYLECELVQGGQEFDVACAERDLAGQLDLIAQLFEVLASVHSLGVVHRDLKPGNVLVTAGQVKLLDFGIATAEGERRLTLSGQFVGTMLYAAPERLNLLATTDPSAGDVWSAGAVACEALTGRPPYACATLGELAGLALRPAPSVGSLRGGLPRAAVRALDAALAFDPTARPSAAGVARALREACRPRRPLGLAGLALAALTVGGLALALGLRARPGATVPEVSGHDLGQARTTLTLADVQTRYAEWIEAFCARGEREEALARAVGEDLAVEALAQALLPPAPASVVPPPEWARIGARLEEGRADLARAVELAQRGRPWSEVSAALDDGRAAQPAAAWDAFQALLAYEQGVPWDPPEDRGDADDGWRALAREVTHVQGLLALTETTRDEDLQRVGRAYLALLRRAGDPSDPRALSEASRRAPDHGRLTACVALDEARLADRGAAIALLDDPALAGGGLFYAQNLAQRARLVLQLATSACSPTALELRIQRRFLELSWEAFPERSGLRLALLWQALRSYPQLRDFVLREAEAQASASQALRSELSDLACYARVAPPLPCYGAPLPPEWQARVDALPGPSGAALREAVERCRAGAPWAEAESALAPAIERGGRAALPLREARALLYLARRAEGALSEQDVSAGLPPLWRSFVHSYWSGAAFPAEVAELALETRVRAALLDADLARLQELARRHGLAAFLVDVRPPDGTRESLEQIDRSLRSVGALYLEVLSVRAQCAWSYAAQEQRPLLGDFGLARITSLAPDGPVLLQTLFEHVGDRPILREQVVRQAAGWPASAAGLRLAAASCDVDSDLGRARARAFFAQADALEPEHTPRDAERRLRERLGVPQPR